MGLMAVNSWSCPTVLETFWPESVAGGLAQDIDRPAVTTIAATAAQLHRIAERPAEELMEHSIS